MLKTTPIKDVKHRITTNSFIPPKDLDFEVLNWFPYVGAGQDFFKLVSAISRARVENKAIILYVGPHVIKCGLSRLIIELMKRKVVTHIAMNGAGMAHDFEIALNGRTSEDVSEGLRDGSFGMTDTLANLNDIINVGDQELGLGDKVKEPLFRDMEYAYKDYSILAQAGKYHVGVTIHVTIGADVINQHSNADGKLLGHRSFVDFQELSEVMPALHDGGVVICLGSSVVFPEVFLKSLNLSRNKYKKPHNFTTAVFDMIKHYRPMENIVKRPVETGGQGFYFIGMHEFMVPLLVKSILERIK